MPPSPTGPTRLLAAPAALAAALSALALCAAPAANAQAPGAAAARSVSATGVGRIEVRPDDRRSERAIREAVAEARAAALAPAMQDARGRAAALAAASGMTLGALLHVEDARVSGAPWGPFGEQEPPFRGGRYCGVVSRPRFRRDAEGRRRRVGTRRVRTCYVPRVVSTAVTLTFAAG